MLRVFANYHNATLALDDLTFFAHGLYGRSYLHTVNLHMRTMSLFTSPCDSAAREIIRRHLNGHLVSGQDLDKVHPELAGNMRQNGVSAADINGEHRIRQCIGNDALKFDYVVFCQDQLTPLVLTDEFLTDTGQFPS